MDTLFDYVLNNSPQGVFCIDKRGNCCYMNSAASNLLNIDVSEAIDSHIAELGLPKEYSDEIEASISSAMNSKNIVEKIIFYKSP